MSGLVDDLRYGARMLAKRPGASALAVLALALGIGLTTVMFSIVQGVVLRGLPFEASDRILFVGRMNRTQPGDELQWAAIHDYADWKRQQRSFSELSAVSQTQATLTVDATPVRYGGARITPDTLRMLRTAPTFGRDFTEADARPGAPRVVLIGYDAWETQFARDPAAVGRAVRLDGEPATVIGVMAKGFGYPNAQKIWMPMSGEPVGPRRTGSESAERAEPIAEVQVIGRLAPGVSIAQANAELDQITRRIEAEHPGNKGISARAVPFLDRFLGDQVRRTLYAMLAAVIGVMLIACANVANLQLARAAERMREIAVRTALGARRARIMRQMLVEGLLLASVGTVLGMVLAHAGIRLFNASILDTSPPFWIDIRIDAVVLAFVTILTVIAALAASLAPALRATRPDPNAILKDEGRGQPSLQMSRMSRWLVVVEVLVSCALLVVSGLAVKSIVTASRIPYPYDPTHIFAARVDGGGARYEDGRSRVRFGEEVEARLRALPGIASLTIASGTPQQSWMSRMTIEGRPAPEGQPLPQIRRLAVSPSFFETFGVSIRQGRAVSASDMAGSLPVAVITETAARTLWPDQDAIGQRVRFGSDEPWLTIVGVASSFIPQGRQPIRDVVIQPFAQNPSASFTVLARTTVDPRSMTSDVRRALVAIDPDAPLTNPDVLANWYRRDAWVVQVFGGLFLSFGLAALVLASAGLYGVMAFHVERRTHEIGVRMALGASRARIVGMVLWQSMWRVGLGIFLGLVPAWFLGELMREVLFNVEPGDVLVFGVTVAGLVLTGLAASSVPARRAASVDPLVALRRD